ncbi:hypothetical protein NG895_27205 [Aeoliella sp. ICT_H6.2]|uniref:Uncharacterized protein n=1 Tax=Aeoliella straminimaris TaxID=2954799 RepID=A0A9X2FEL2_9BACT|nr:hypothetical protein [Aeoliella straminimaris]MCO6047610.1 hypothetical protein [Aeoliella straminimaris]
MNHRRQPVLQLIACLATIAIVWCVLLPRLSRQPSVEQRLDWLAAERIDPSAMFYTELERMPELMPEGVE